MSGMTGFLVAVGGVSMICYWLMTRVENRSARRGSDGSSSDYGNDSSIGGWTLANWFSIDNSSSGSSDSSSASGSWDSGGSDGGGSGGDGGGGGD